MFVFLWIFLGLSCQKVNSYIETVIVSGCENCKLYLTCRHLTSIIGILEANFVQEVNETTDFNDTLVAISTPFPPYHPRQALNQRCSGVNHCSFILTEDCPGAETWGPGNITIKYVCISESEITRFCNSVITLEHDNLSGFIHNVGYPRFYSSEKECTWRIKTRPEQKIKVTVLDIALTADRKSSSNECSDSLTFLNSDGQIIGTTCEKQDPPFVIISENEQLDVALVSHHSLTPLRGVLLYFTAIGCPTPDAPEDGYLIYRNETSAEFSCCINLRFEDSGKKRKIIHCLGAKWNIELPLPNCTKPKKLQKQLAVGEIKVDMASDILAPALIIAALFLINFIVLFYIYKIKQKHAIEFADEELGTLQETDEKTSS